jgi:hypothetical protein
MNTKKLVPIGLALVCILLITACSLSSSVPIQEPLESAEGETSDDQTETLVEDAGEILQSCFEARSFVLNFDHTLTIKQPQTSLTHILKQGGIAIIADCNAAETDCAMRTVAPQTLGYEYMGVVGVCSVEATGNVIVSAEGFCSDGIVSLTITEDWQSGQGTMTCDDTAMPFPVPGYTATHSGPDGQGEEFLITSDANGFTLMREFQGGEGYHSWTLVTDIDNVPLVPEED